MLRRTIFFLFLFVPIYLVPAQVQNDENVIFEKEIKINTLKVKRIFYKKCPGITTISCDRNIEIVNNNSLNFSDFIDDDDDFGNGLRYIIKKDEILVLNANRLLLGTSKNFWLKNFGIVKFETVKYKHKRRDYIKINDLLSYQNIQYKTSNVLKYSVKVNFLNEKLLSKNIGIISDAPYITVYIIGGDLNKSLEVENTMQIYNKNRIKTNSSNNFHEIKHQ